MVANKEMFFKIMSLDREDNKWDYKQDIHLKPKEQFYELLKDILAFSNSGGGHLLLGVEDKTHNLIGITNFIDEADLGQKIQTALGYSLNVELNYFKHFDEGNEVKLGILYIPNSHQIRTCAKTLTGSKGTIIQSDIVYVRRNTSSINANSEDLQELAYKIIKKGKYEFSERDKEIIERNKDYSQNMKDIYDYLKGEYRFSTLNFSHKLNEIYFNQIKYNKLEFAVILGLDEDKIDDYFNGLAIPRIEHILRATEIFNLPNDYFFQPTISLRKPLWYSPMISHCIIEKVKEKQILFSIENGEFYQGVFLKLARSLNMFAKWLRSDRQVKPENEIDIFFSDYNHLEDYVVELTDEEYEKYKKHLSTQFYKLLELVGQSGPKPGTLTDEEYFIFKLIGKNDEYVCRIINESIKEIKVNSQKEILIQYHYLYELENLIVRGRSYDSLEVKVELQEENKIGNR